MCMGDDRRDGDGVSFSPSLVCFQLGVVPRRTVFHSLE
jgi:hypothetical protein